jgi:paraquat-inducible protein B
VLVHDDSRFWDISGVSLSTGAQGFKLQFESLQAVLSGGIAFETPKTAPPSVPAKEGTVFALFPDHDSVQDASYTEHFSFLVEFSGSVHGLESGAPVEFRGVRIGQVTDVHLEFDSRTNTVSVPVILSLERQRVRLVDAPIPRGPSLMGELVAHGVRAQLRTSSLITGQLFVALDFFPNAPPAQLITTGRYAQIPTVPTDLESIASSLSDVLNKVSALPIDQLVQDLRKTLQSYQGLAETPELRESLKSLSKVLANTEVLTREANTEVGPMIASLRKMADAATLAFDRADTLLASVTKGYGGDSSMRRELGDLVRQLQETVKSVKLLADYLEQHPDSLIRGKTAGAAR